MAGYVLPPLVTGDVVRMRVYCWCNQQLSINTYSYVIGEIDVGSTNVLMWDLGMYLLVAAHDMYVPIMSEFAEFLGIGLQKLTTPITGEAQFTTSMAFLDGLGLDAGQPLPTNITGLLRRSGIKPSNNRQKNGRVYLPFPSENSNGDGSVPVNTYRANVTLLGENLSMPHGVTYNGTTYNLVPCLELNNTIPAGWANISLTSASNRWGQQHRRGDFGKMNPRWPG